MHDYSPELFNSNIPHMRPLLQVVSFRRFIAATSGQRSTRCSSKTLSWLRLVKEEIAPSGSVSWTHTPVTWYLHEVSS